MKDSFKSSMLIIGTTIGAGFASGREIVEFYGRFGYGAFPLIFLSGVLFFVIISVLLAIGAHASANKIENANTVFFGKMAGFADIIIMLNYILVISAMLSGSDALLEGYTELPIMSIITMLLTAIIVLMGLRGLKAVNAFITPALIVLILITVVLTIFNPSSTAVESYFPQAVNTPRQIINCLLYVGLNILLAGGVLVETNHPKKTIMRTSFVCSAVLTVLMSLILFACFVAGDDVMNAGMPLLAMATEFNFHYIAIVIIWLGIFTTLLASTYVLSSWLKPVLHYRAVGVVIVLLAGFVISLQGFKTIVSAIYPLTGVCGIIYSLLALIYFARIKAREAVSKLPKLGKKQRNLN